MIGLSSLIGSSTFTPASGDIASAAIKSQTIKHVSTETTAALTNCAKFPYRSDYKPLQLEGVTIMVNPGHGETTPRGKLKTGSVGKIGKEKIFEYKINQEIATSLEGKLKTLGADVIIIKEIPPAEIQAKKNEMRPDIFLAIHADAKAVENAKTKAKRIKQHKMAPQNFGKTVYRFGDGERLGAFIENEYKHDTIIPTHLNTPNRTAWARGLKVLRGDTTIAAVLIESGYMTSNKEVKLLSKKWYQDDAANITVKGIVKYIKALRDEKIPKKSENQLLWERMTRTAPTRWTTTGGIDP